MESAPRIGNGPRARPRLGHQPGLDGLRGVAVATVLFYHAGFSWMRGGYLGVSTFFTLSGFLITSLLLAEHRETGRINLSSFWERRFRRIMPASFLALVLAIVFGGFFADAYQREHLRSDGLMTLAYGINWWFILSRRDYADIFGSPSPVQHFWSLAIEEQFYLVFPFLTFCVLRISGGSGRVFALVLGGLSAISLGWMHILLRTDVPTARLYYGTDTRAVELLGGALLAVLLANLPSTVSRRRHFITTALGLGGLALSATFWMTMHQEEHRLYAGGLTIYTAASMAILAATVLPSGPMRRVLSWGPLRELGRVSYGVYLYHFPVFLCLTGERTGFTEPLLTALRFAVSLLLAQLSFRWVEVPIRRGEAITGRQRYLVPPAALAALIVALLTVTGDRSGRSARSWGMSGEVATTVVAPPSNGATSREKLRILVVGDSVANNIGTALVRWAATQKDVQVQVEAVRGCGIVHGGLEARRDAKIRDEACAKWVAGWPEVVRLFRPQVILLYAGGWDLLERRLPDWDGPKVIGDPMFDEWLAAQYRETIEVLSARGARVVWLSSLCVKSRSLNTDGVFDPQRVLGLNRLIARLVKEYPGRVSSLDLFAEVCPNGAFVENFHGIEGARPDGVHFSPAAGDRVAAWIGSHLTLGAAGH